MYTKEKLENFLQTVRVVHFEVVNDKLRKETNEERRIHEILINCFFMRGGSKKRLKNSQV